MAKRRITDIARERGLDPNEVAARLHEAGVAVRGDLVDEAAAARALAGSRPTGAGAKAAQRRRRTRPHRHARKAAAAAAGTAGPSAGHGAAASAAAPPAAAERPARPGAPATPPAPRTRVPTRPARPRGPRSRRGAPAPGRPRSRRPAPRRPRPPRRASRCSPPPGAPVRPSAAPPAPGGAGSRARPQRGVPAGKRRRVVIDSQAARGPREKQQRGRDPGREREPKVAQPRPTGPVTVPSGVTVKELADKLSVSAAEIIKMMFASGEMVTITQSLTDEAVELIGGELEREITIKRAEEEVEDIPEDAAEDLQTRAPIVTIMGHVDHGKTTLLDAIRETSVASGEAGGITQHIGAYQVEIGDRKVTFLDTPGHEAFTALRARGAKVTDVAVLVVAADDGVMPQTIEAMDHAKAAGVPIVVAVNKIDRPDANPAKVRQELVVHGLQPEEWGGDTVFVDVSAKQKEGLDSLLEMLLLQSDVLELKANPDAEASGPIIESRLDVGPRPGRHDARPARHAARRRRRRRGRRLGQGARHARRERRAPQGGRPGHAGRDPRLRQAAAGRRDAAASSTPTAPPGSWRRSAPPGCAPRASCGARSPSRSRTCSIACRKARSASST